MMDCKQALTEAKGDMEAGDRSAAQEGCLGRSQESDARDQRRLRRQLHSRRRQNWRAGRSELRERFRGAHRRLQRTRARHRHAHCGQRSEVRPQGRRHAEGISSARKDIYRAQAVATGKPPTSSEKMVEGKMEKFYEEVCLLEQPFIKDQTVSHLATHRRQDRQAGREHRGAPLRPLQSGRCAATDSSPHQPRAESSRLPKAAE